MKNQTLRIPALALIAGLLISTGNRAYPQQVGAPNLGDGSADQMVQVGETVTFYVEPVAGDTYQWLLNGNAISGQTNSTLTIENAQTSDAGYYSCNVANGSNVTPTVSASMQVFTMNENFDVVVYGQPIYSGGSSGSCPGKYTGYVTYTKTVAQGWGWTPASGTTTFTATDTTQTNTKVEYVGDYGDEGCAQTTVTIPYPTFSPAYRFSIYFTNAVPTTNYPITLTGFNP